MAPAVRQLVNTSSANYSNNDNNAIYEDDDALIDSDFGGEHKSTVAQIPESQQTGFLACVVNLANVAMGAGVLAYPNSLKNTGFIAGPLLAVMAAGIMFVTLQTVAVCSDKAYELARKGRATIEIGSYQEIVVAILGKFWGKVLTWMLFIYLTLTNICFMTILYDQAEPVILSQLGEDSVLNKRAVLVPLCGFIVCFPLTLIPNMNLFAIPSSISQVGLLFGVGLVTYYSFRDFDSNKDVPSYHPPLVKATTEPMAYIDAFPIFAFSFQCHVTFPLIYASMRKRTFKKITAVNATTIMSCLVIYLAMGMSGYLLLGAATPGDILAGLCGSGDYFDPTVGAEGCCISNSSVTSCPKTKVDIANVVARGCVFIKVACSYGMLVYVSRTCFKDLFLPAGKPFTPVQKHLQNFLYVAFTIGMGILFQDMTLPMEFAGILVIVIDIVYPGVMQVKISKTQRGKVLGYVLIVFGVVLSITSVISAVLKATSKSK